MLKINEYMSITEAAKLLGVTKMTLRNWENKNKIKSYRNPINKYRLYKRDELEEFLKDLSTKK